MLQMNAFWKLICPNSKLQLLQGSKSEGRHIKAYGSYTVPFPNALLHLGLRHQYIELLFLVEFMAGHSQCPNTYVKVEIEEGLQSI